jgi:hypothetical protein
LELGKANAGGVRLGAKVTPVVKLGLAGIFGHLAVQRAHLVRPERVQLQLRKIAHGSSSLWTIRDVENSAPAQRAATIATGKAVQE